MDEVMKGGDNELLPHQWQAKLLGISNPKEMRADLFPLIIWQARYRTLSNHQFPFPLANLKIFQDEKE
jgi:hypothetical protein